MSRDRQPPHSGEGEPNERGVEDNESALRRRKIEIADELVYQIRRIFLDDPNAFEGGFSPGFLANFLKKGQTVSDFDLYNSFNSTELMDVPEIAQKVEDLVTELISTPPENRLTINSDGQRFSLWGACVNVQLAFNLASDYFHKEEWQKEVAEVVARSLANRSLWAPYGESVVNLDIAIEKDERRLAALFGIEDVDSIAPHKRELSEQERSFKETFLDFLSRGDSESASALYTNTFPPRRWLQANCIFLNRDEVEEVAVTGLQKLIQPDMTDENVMRAGELLAYVGQSAEWLRARSGEFESGSVESFLERLRALADDQNEE